MGQARVGPTAHPLLSEQSSETVVEATVQGRLVPEQSPHFHQTLSGRHLQKVDSTLVEATLPEWKEQITFRAIGVSLVLGTLFSIIVHRLNFTTGVIPSLNIAAGLLGFFSIKTWMTLLNKIGLSAFGFTAQENTVIQTCVVSCYGLAFYGGFGSYLIAMDRQSYQNLGDAPGNREEDVYEPTLGRVVPYMLSIAVIGIFMLVPLRKMMVIDYKLPYPSGTATGLLINSFHTPQGAETAKRQVSIMAKWFSISFVWDAFLWLVGNCNLHVQSIAQGLWSVRGFQWAAGTEFSLNYVGVGMICPHAVNLSMMLSAIVSWGFLWPWVRSKEGDWYPAGAASYDFQGLTGYKSFLAISIFLGDGLYNFVKVIAITIKSAHQRLNRGETSDSEEYEVLPGSSHAEEIDSANEETGASESKGDTESHDDRRLRTRVFVKDQIPAWVAGAGYSVLCVLGCAVIPLTYRHIRWYYVLLSFFVAPVLAIANSYGCGLTDWNMAGLYGKLGIFIFAAWAGADGGVIAGLGICGVLLATTGSAADLMQDFKTGYLTLSSPRAMFVTQVIGAVFGSIIGPLTFQIFWRAFPIGDPNGPYPAPYGTLYRAMAILGTQGLSSLPDHCLQLCGVFFASAVLINLGRDFLPRQIGQLLPIPMAFAIPFFLGPSIAVNMTLGSLVVYLWRKFDADGAELLVAACASGIVAGDGVFTIPTAAFSIAGVVSPFCRPLNVPDGNKLATALLRPT